MSTNVISFGKPKAANTEQVAQKEMLSEPTNVPGLWRAYVEVDESNLDQLNEACGKVIDECPGDLVMIIGLNKNITQASDFEAFRNAVLAMFDRIHDDVIMGHMLEMHDGLPDETRSVVETEANTFMARVKHSVATDIYPLSTVVVQWSVNTFGLMLTLAYGSGSVVYDRSSLISFTFKPKQS